MALTADQIQKMSAEIGLSAVVNYLYGRETVLTKHPLISSLFPSEYVNRSVIGGLETSLGTSLWEKLALEFASCNSIVMHHPSNFKKISNLPSEITTIVNNLDITAKPKSIIDEFLMVARRESSKFSAFKPRTNKMDKGHGADLYFELDNDIYVVDIKTVQWNAAGGDNFLHRLIKWGSYAIFFHPNKNVKVKIVIPYNPFQLSWWQHSKKKAEPLWETDILVESEFWDLLTGLTDSYIYIEKGFNSIKNNPIIRLFESRFTDPVDQVFKRDILELYRNIKITNWESSTKGNSAKVEATCNQCMKSFVTFDYVLLLQDSCPEHDSAYVSKKKFREIQEKRWYGLGNPAIK